MAKAVEELNLDNYTSQLSAHIWGHRFKASQRGPEYVLEFLNVIAGTQYSFSAESYNRKLSIGLRKFIFEGLKSGSNSKELCKLDEDEKNRLMLAFEENNYYALKDFLRNLQVPLIDTTGKDADRSWYARSVFPLHESLLFFEVREKKKGEVYVERNFYARGGELYYLMLAIGTDNHQERREFIEQRLRQLLTKNTVIQRAANKITAAFDEQESGKSSIGKLRAEEMDDAVPLLPESARTEQLPLFERFAVELEQLLKLDLDVYNMFHLMTSLICFQLARYMQARAPMSDRHGASWYFIDCQDGRQKLLMQQAAASFDAHENRIKDRFDYEFERKYKERMGDPEQVASMLPIWQADPKRYLELVGLKKLRSGKKYIIDTLMACKQAEDVHGKLKRIVQKIVSDQLRKDLLNITRTLGRDGGFATYRRGSASNYRYTLSDICLQMLVYTSVKPKEKLAFTAFLDSLYRDYGIVIGESQAKQSGLYDVSGLNARYFQDNEKSLREKLRQNGLLIEFSDATAMVRNPNDSVMEDCYA